MEIKTLTQKLRRPLQTFTAIGIPHMDPCTLGSLVIQAFSEQLLPTKLYVRPWG